MNIQIAIFDQLSRAEVLARVLGGRQIARAANGKPYVRLSSSTQAGISFTHVRQAHRPFSIVAVCDEPQMGIDAEVWPCGKADPAFLDSVASAEDQALVTRILKTGHDAARFLWVVKEAALKASGEVMVDPRDLAVELSQQGHISVSTARQASAPTPEMRVQVLQLKAGDSDEIVLLAIAFGAKLEPRIVFSESNWALQSIIVP